MNPYLTIGVWLLFLTVVPAGGFFASILVTSFFKELPDWLERVFMFVLKFAIFFAFLLCLHSFAFAYNYLLTGRLL